MYFADNCIGDKVPGFYLELVCYINARNPCAIKSKPVVSKNRVDLVLIYNFFQPSIFGPNRMNNFWKL